MEPDFETVQTVGTPGWIVLSHEKNIPTCTWVTSHETKVLDICLDERLYGDTIFRVERNGNAYIIADIWLYNSNCIFACSTFKQRYEWLKRMMATFYTTHLSVLVHKSDLSPDISIRGKEFYSSKVGESGTFIENDNEIIFKTEIPDVYTVKGKTGYVLVPDLKTSAFLRSKGDSFNLKCVSSNENWKITENIPELK